ncbi:MAG: tRNA preQ1(34) S-adenosylmethionine ribosyltransferase-isomerase QueA [candidate division Zixibacteria bacterium]|nr:tRNA preQ1(34) S-adenosylmethionine ribosyltransferase-isomerase QueA [candidate division Zixibacteria bacterium]
MKLSDYDYNLPRGFIAQYPAENRDNSRLMVLHKDTEKVEHKHFHQIIDYIDPGDCIVINNSKVFAARLFGNREPTGGKVEVFLLRKIEGSNWEALVRPGKKLLPGTVVNFSSDFSCKIGDRTEVGGRIVELITDKNIDDAIEEHGHIPLPPYISRIDEESDREKYQTVYASVKGAVAAPTAGFHFTPELLKALEEKGVEIAQITLHPSLGTFRPVTVQNPLEHKMEPEYYNLPAESAEKINNSIRNGGRIIGVGTTSVRTLEKVATNNENPGKYLVEAGTGQTNLYIYPSYEYKIIRCLITNFHLPKSTLLFLVSAFANREFILRAYEEAKKEGYRFYSYGDAMLII